VAGAEAIALTIKPGRALWTDDFPMGAIARSEHNITRVVMALMVSLNHAEE